MRARNLALLFLLWFTLGWRGMVRLEAQEAGLPPAVLHYADSVLYNGKILTANAQFTIVEAVAVRDGRVLAIGPTNRILSMAGPNTRRIDLKGKTVTPGIFNLHEDVFGSGFVRFWTQKWLSNDPGVKNPKGGSLPIWEDKEKAREGIQRIMAKAKPGEPVILVRIVAGAKANDTAGGRGGFICEVFTLQELDAITPNNPVFFFSQINTSPMATNSRGAEAIKRFLPKGVSSPFLKSNNICVGGGVLDVDGVLTPGQQAVNDYAYWIDPADSNAVLPEYRAIQREQNEQGVVLVRGHMAVPEFNGVRALWERGELTVRFRMPFPVVPQISGHAVEVPPEDAETLFRRWANMSKIGDNMLRVVGMRVPAVGGNQASGNAWTLEPKIRPYPDQYGNPAPYGGWALEQKAMETGSKETFRGREAIIQACRFGWDTAADHTVGDRSYREVIKAYAECLKDQVVKRPTQRLTTGHTPMAHPDDIALAAKLGVRSNISTGHALGTEIEVSLLEYGTERVDKWAPVKSLLKAGIHPALEGTFWRLPPGASSFYWVSKYITRKDDLYGRVWNPSEALTRQEALWATTIWAAEQLAEEKEIGGIAVGKEADLLVIDKDYMTVPADDIGTIKPLLTMVGGKVVYEAAGAL